MDHSQLIDRIYSWSEEHQLNIWIKVNNVWTKAVLHNLVLQTLSPSKTPSSHWKIPKISLFNVIFHLTLILFQSQTLTCLDHDQYSRRVIFRLSVDRPRLIDRHLINKVTFLSEEFPLVVSILNKMTWLTVQLINTIKLLLEEYLSIEAIVINQQWVDRHIQLLVYRLLIDGSDLEVETIDTWQSNDQQNQLSILRLIKAVIIDVDFVGRMCRMDTIPGGHWSFRPITKSAHDHFGPWPFRPIPFRPTILILIYCLYSCYCMV